MSYSNAIFYLNHASGSDAVRATLTGVVFAQNGTGVRGHYVGHSLVTGAVVTVSGCTQAYANSAWKITTAGADDFDLDGALWASFNGADVTGNAVPYGGSSWADAWLTVASGATAARIAPGDVIRIAKTPDPVSFGQAAQWITTAKTGGGDLVTKNIVSSADTTPIRIRATGHGLVTGDIARIANHATNYNANGVWFITRVDDNYFDLDNSTATGGGAGGATGVVYPRNSQCVVLTTAVTTKIDDCEGGWAVDNTSTVTNQTTGQLGYAVKVAKSSPGNNTLYAHKALPASLNLSGYDAITLWISVATAIDATTRWKVCLCSDTAGATVQDEFLLPVMAAGRFYALTITKNGGGNLYNGIQSVALYSGSAGATTTGVTIDNINACTAGGFAVGDMVSKNSLAVGGTEGFWWVAAIYGRILALDGARGYYGTAESVTTYYRKTQTIGAAETVNDSGTAGNLIQYLGGWNISTTEQDGETYLDGMSLAIIGFSGATQTYWKVDRISVIRVDLAGLSLAHNTGMVEIGDINDLYYNGTGIDCAQAGSMVTINNLRRVNANTLGIDLQCNNFNITAIGQCCSNTDGIEIGAGGGTVQGVITAIDALCNNTESGADLTCISPRVIFGTIGKASYNGVNGIQFNGAMNCIIETIAEANYNIPYGVYFTGTAGNNEINEITDCSYNSTYGVGCGTTSGYNYIGSVVTSNNGTGGILNQGQELFVGKATLGEATKIALGTSNLPLVGIMEWGGTADRWYRQIRNGVMSDQITGGQNAAWSYGGAGLCQYYNPSSTTAPMMDEFFIPCTAAQGVQVHFQVKKTSAAADCLMVVSISGCGITPIRRSSVTLTDAWAEYTSATVTPARTGFLRVCVEFIDGATTGDIGIDDIHYLEV